MSLTKTLQTLIERAERNGQATKRVREGAIMGSWNIVPEDVKKTPMIDQWRVTIANHDGHAGDWQVISVDHYGTEIACITIDEGIAQLRNHYGESVTDANALSGLCSYYGMSYRFSFKPSKDLFERVC